MTSISGSNASHSAQSISNYSSHESRSLYDGDKCSIAQHGDNGLSVFDKQTGKCHEGSGDFGQSGLQGQGQSKLIDQIVDKILDKLGEALGIDLSSLKSGGGQTPEAGGGHGGHGTPGSTCRHENFPPVDPRITMQAGGETSAPRGGAANKPDLTQTHMPGDFLGLGNVQNVKDHNAIEKLADPFGIF